MKQPKIIIRRIYEPVLPDDGMRVLVDRLWPRGITRESAKIDFWMREIGPSNALRQWFGHDQQRWEDFRTRYRAELEANREPFERLKTLCDTGPVTLLFAARDIEHNNAVVLAELLTEK